VAHAEYKDRLPARFCYTRHKSAGGVLAGCHLLRLIKTKTFRTVAVIALLIGLYALAGFVLAPRLLRSALMKDIPQALGVTPAVGEIRFNPFLFQLRVNDFSLSVPGGDKLLGFEQLFVDFQLSSIWHRAYTFVSIDITAPSVNAVVARDGSLNLLRLRPQSPAPKPQEKSEPLPAIRFGSFKVSKGLLSYEDRSRPSEFATRLEPINFELRDFTTGAEGGRFTFTGATKLGERIEWSGHLSAQPIESDGEFKLVGLQAHTIWDYIEDQVSFAVNSGSIDLNATYMFSLKDALELKLDVSKVAVSDLAVRPKQSDVDWITIPQLLVTGTTVDLSKRQARVESLSLTGVKLVTWLEPDGSFNLLKLASAPPRTPMASTAAPATPGGAVPTTPAPPPAPAASAAPQLTTTAPAAAGPPWLFELRKFDLKEASISAEDRSTKPPAKVLLAPLSLQIEGASQDLARPLPVSLETKINEKGSLSVSGEITPQPLAVALSLKPSNIDLTTIQPYIAKSTSMTLLAGRLSGDVKVQYGAKKPAVQLTGNVSVAGLHTIDNTLRDDFINWERLDLVGLNYQHDPDRLSIEQIVARKPYARVIIEPDTSLNVKRVLAGPAAKSAAGTAASATPSRAALASGRRKSVPNAAPHAEAATMPFPMAIKKVVVHAGQANFSDLSIQPNFAAGIRSLEGTVLGLSSTQNSRAKVDLHGEVDALSPVSITGEVNPFSTALSADLALDFRNMELTLFNPYSGKFAGYNITKGKLTTELHYKVDGRKLDAQHHIVVDQLEFGDKTASKDAVSLPVKLAVALLKDRHGVIDLSIPVNGSLDDPQFKVWPIIWKVFVNILEKAVTAPFALLGALFGGGPDLQFIEFQPGVGQLDSAGADKVKTVVKALAERPQLKIDVPIGEVAELDRPALIEAQFLAQVREAQAAKGSGKKTAAEAPALDQMDPAARLDLLAKLYEKKVGGEPKYPDSIASIKAKPDVMAAKTDFLAQELHAHIVIAEAELDALGQQRAVAVQQALLTDTQIDPARVFLVANDKAKKQDGKVRLELSLK
jgi:hypothetical protein